MLRVCHDNGMNAMYGLRQTAYSDGILDLGFDNWMVPDSMDDSSGTEKTEIV